ncbi:MAG TPA: winged helix-turn-helix domain-containing protein, partial [Chloroflexota bacterium]|nr:winged helix-turn-helix domain-containing protein [Chloroflexota bacterium]
RSLSADSGPPSTATAGPPDGVSSFTPPHARRGEQRRAGGLVLDLGAHQAIAGSTPLHLTRTEIRLLASLLQQPGVALSRRQIGELVWGHYDEGIGRTIDVHIRRLRAKLEETDLPARAVPTIVSVRGVGYRLMPAQNADASSAA